jgi:hypothetical protein
MVPPVPEAAIEAAAFHSAKGFPGLNCEKYLQQAPGTKFVSPNAVVFC